VISRKINDDVYDGLTLSEAVRAMARVWHVRIGVGGHGAAGKRIE